MKKRSLIGYITVSGIGGFQEKFFSAMFKAGIKLWEVKQISGGFTAKMQPYKYLKAKRIAKSCGVELKIEKRSGLYFFLKKYNKRLGVVCGLFLMGIITTGLSNHVWDIEIIGNDTIPDSSVLSVLEECGISVGVAKTDIDYSLAQQTAMLRLGEVGWFGMELTGCRLNVKVSEKIDIPEMVETDVPCNVVAARDGKIVLTEVYSGTQLVQVGDGINKGGMLVSGTVVDSAGNILYEHASAKFIADFTETRDFFVPFESIEQAACGDETKRNYLLLMNSTIPLFWGDGQVDNAKYTEEIYNQYLFGFELPYKVKVGTYIEYRDINVVRTTEQIVSELREQKSVYESNFLSDYDITECREAYTTDENGITLSVFYKLRGNIAKQEKIELNFEKNAFNS